MHRIAPVLLIGGLLLLATSLGAPASPPPSLESPPAPAIDAQSRDVWDAVAAEVARLRERLAAPPGFPQPERDPFRFAVPVPPAPPADHSGEPPPAPPAPALPTLVAVMSSGDTAPSRTAFLAIGDEVRQVAVGDPVGEFVVERIDDDGLVLYDPVLQVSHRLSLRRGIAATH